MTPSELSITARLIYNEAQKRGIGVQLFDNVHLLRLEKDGVVRFTCCSRTSLQSSVGMTIADDKGITKELLLKEQLPTSPGGVVANREELDVLLNTLHFPLVIKPVLGSHGDGVVVGISHVEEAIRVYDQLSVHSDRVVIEEQVDASNDFRVVVINHTFVAATQRVPAHVVGDGTHTINELVELKNQDPNRGDAHYLPLSTIVIDDDVESYLRDQSLGLDNVMADGEIAWLKKTANLSTGGEGWDVTDDVHPSNIEMFERISCVCDLTTIGIDVMADNLSIDLNDQSGAILEVNASPGLRMHHYPSRGEARNVAGAILDLLFKVPTWV